MAIELERVKAAETFFRQIGMRRYGFLPLELQVAFHQIASENPAHQARLIELGRHFERLSDLKLAMLHAASALKVMKAKGRTNALMYLLEETKRSIAKSQEGAAARPAAQGPIKLAQAKLTSLLEWRTSIVRLPGIKGLLSKKRVRITHWVKHDPKKLLAALEAEPSDSFPDSMPKFTVHPFGKHLLIARRFKRGGHYKGSNDYHPPENVFNWLVELVKNKNAILEMPVALVDHPTKGMLVVTLWKKHERTLLQAFLARDLSLREKEALAKKAVRQLARLNAAGYTHSHSFARNYVVLKNGEVRLIDPTLLKQRPDNPDFYGIEGLMTQISRGVENTPERLSENQFIEMHNRIRKEYFKELNKRMLQK